MKTTSALLFYLPLAIAGILESFSNPDQLWIGTHSLPELALAGYQVAYSFAWIFVGIAFNIHQVVIVFANDAASRAKVKRFVWAVGIITTCSMLLLTLSGGTAWVMRNLIGVDDDIMHTAVNNVIVLSFYASCLLCQRTICRHANRRQANLQCHRRQNNEYGRHSHSYLLYSRLYAAAGTLFGRLGHFLWLHSGRNNRLLARTRDIDTSAANTHHP